jgi:hypothetical protein
MQQCDCSDAIASSLDPLRDFVQFDPKMVAILA